jgi:hypothetical protein
MRTDKFGNKLIVERSKVHSQIYIDLYLKLPAENYRRSIARINTNALQMHLHRSKDKHLLNKANAYGINHYILSEGTTFEDVVIHEEETSKIFMVNKKFLLSSALFLHFKSQGFERQIFINRDWLLHYEVTNEIKKQNLFNIYHKKII